MRPSTVAIVCPDCETRTELPPDEIAAALTRHNETRHDGAPVASVAGAHVDRLAVADADEVTR